MWDNPMFRKSMAPRKPKYKNDRVTAATGCGLHSHRSKLEASVCAILQFRLRAGEFKEILIEQSVYLTEARIQYVADWKCVKPDGSLVFVESKGFETSEWRIKRKLWTYYGPSTLEVWKGTAYRPMLHEVINPKGLLRD